MGCFSQSQVVVGYTNNGSGAIRVEVGTTAPLGTYVIITGSGTAMADGTWKIHIIDATHFDLIGSTYVGPGAFFFGNAGYYTMGLNLEPETSADGQNPQDFLTCVPSFEADFNSVVTDQSCDAVAAVSSWKITV
jgi:hypothetical protein